MEWRMKNEDIKGLDVKKGLALVANNAAVYQKLLKSFVTNAFCEQLLEAVKSGDPEAIRQKAHSFKGVSGNMQMGELFELTRQIEADAKSGNAAAATDESVARLIAANKQTLESVTMLLDNPNILKELE